MNLNQINGFNIKRLNDQEIVPSKLSKDSPGFKKTNPDFSKISFEQCELENLDFNGVEGVEVTSILLVDSMVVHVGFSLMILGSSETISFSGLIFGVSTVTLTVSSGLSVGDSVVDFLLAMTLVVELTDLFSV